MSQQTFLDQFGTIYRIFFVLPSVRRVIETDPLDKELRAALVLPRVHNRLHFPLALVLLLERYVM
jgi:hypothetical protein